MIRHSYVDPVTGYSIDGVGETRGFETASTNSRSSSTLLVRNGASLMPTPVGKSQVQGTQLNQARIAGWQHHVNKTNQRSVSTLYADRVRSRRSQGHLSMSKESLDGQRATRQSLTSTRSAKWLDPIGFARSNLDSLISKSSSSASLRSAYGSHHTLLGEGAHDVVIRARQKAIAAADLTETLMNERAERVRRQRSQGLLPRPPGNKARIAAEKAAAAEAAEEAKALRLASLAEKRQALKNSPFVRAASDAIAMRFQAKDMFKAFQYFDLDRSGTLNKQELARVIDLWNIPLDEEKLNEIVEACDNE